jgi:uncharacterized protein YdaU (DUF1376 family)
MTGLSRFDFYPRDWHLDTRDLSNAAKGVYIDLLASMYARGAPLPNDERELCRLCGCATARSLRPLLRELLNKGKLRLVDGHLINGRAMEEIAKFDRQKAVSSLGGKAKAEAEAAASEQRPGPVDPDRGEPALGNGSGRPDATAAARQRRYRERHRNGNRNGVQPEFGSNSTGTQPETRADIVENQWGNECPPSPSPSKVPPTEGAGAPFDPEKPVFDLGKQILGKSAGGQVRNLIRHHGGNLDATMQTLQRAARKSDAREYIGAILSGDRQPETDWGVEYRRMGVSL